MKSRINKIFANRNKSTYIDANNAESAPGVFSVFFVLEINVGEPVQMAGFFMPAGGFLMVLFVFLLVSLFGLVAHWFKRWIRVQTSSTLVEYLMNHKGYTLSSITAQIAAAIGLISMGNTEITLQTLSMAFMAGYVVDSSLNKDPFDR